MARLRKSSEDGLVVVLCATHAILIWIMASNSSTDACDHLIGSIVAQTSVTPTSIVAGKFLENTGGAEIASAGTRQTNDSRTAATIEIKEDRARATDGELSARVAVIMATTNTGNKLSP